MLLDSEKKQTIVALLKSIYPGWSNFSDANFIKDEIKYKRKAIAEAHRLLGKRDLSQLIEKRNYDEIISRLKKVGSTNLLYWMPSSGDLGILKKTELDKRGFSIAIIDLLYGPGSSEERLDRYLNFVKASDLPNKWTFPTYFLFMCSPETEMFVKPRAMEQFLKFAGRENQVQVKNGPSGEAYASIKGISYQLKDDLKEYGPQDMVDIQSIIFLCSKIKDEIYDADRLAEDTRLNELTLQGYLQALNRKGQAILYGPPGTGKTFLAERLAHHLVSDGDGFVDLVQFHPAYSYEDFIQGIRPLAREDGLLKYDVVPGRFLEFCKRAGNCQGICVLIIDEINRANLARVFGELMYLLEYREREIPLSTDGELFKIPENVRIIGTMNTADRSIALVDHALRRRFAFIKLQPDYEVLKRYHIKENNGFPINNLIQVLGDLNRAIKDPNYEIGISYFLKPDLMNHLESIWKMEIEPYLEEYFFDNTKSVEQFRWESVKPALGL